MFCNSHRSLCFASFAALSLVSFAGCGESHPNEKQVFKILGTVTVDGKPVGEVQVALHDTAGADAKNPTYPQGFTNPDGTIRVSTYADGDGAPSGEYNVTFSWQEYNMMSRSYSGPDKLNKKYSDPKTTPIKLSLGPAKSNDLGKVELTTKK